ncbi:IK cytokine down-regulator of HLA class II [Phaffia rhodozyma]|uniref:IK cytokine down-regulator of HLA class II n=1 Tax=Phaffia rhodozyma TaxID=264483 RepID=A0A0F7SET2_PHARH|nr:IK cytokine down-regulator of HLA class II [Phaffia rhodozyma]
MNQESFRQFLSAPRPDSASAASAGSSSTRSLGGAGPKRGYQPPPSKKEKPAEGSSQAFKPRKVRKPTDEKEQSKYQDRASQRRAGLEDEYSGVIALKDEFERRAAAEGEDAAALEEKRKYLGGDADHSILVKGLDFALLAKNKAELEASQNQIDDDELEQAFNHGQSSSTFNADPLPATKKRSREEILAAVNSKKRALGSAAPSVPDAPRLNSKFKPIGEKEKEKKKKKKKNEAVGLEGEKKMRKKKKKVTDGQPEDGSVVSTSGGVPDASSVDPSTATMVDPIKAPSPESLPAPLPAKQKVYAKPLVQPSLDEDDIFGGVSDYEPDADDDDDDDDGSAQDDHDQLKTETDPIAQPSSGRDWFGSNPTTSSSVPTSSSIDHSAPVSASVPAPGPESSTTSTRMNRSPSPLIQYNPTRLYSRSPSRSPTPPPTAGSGRLVPLSGSAVPSVKELLAHSEEAEAVRIRKSKKAAWRAKQGLAKQEDGVEDEDEGGRGWRKEETGEKDEEKRLNREYRQYERFQKKKEGTS